MNATVGLTQTKFHFSIAVGNGDREIEQSKESPLYGLLDRIAQFLRAPLLGQPSLDRNVKTIDAVHESNLRSDHWRLFHLRQSLSNPMHPVSRFATGSLETLDGTDQSELKEYHESYYAAAAMKITILGPVPLDRLEGWAIELFSEIQDKDLVRARWDSVPLFTENQLATQVFTDSVTNQHMLCIDFPFLDEDNLYETLPSQYINHLINYQGSGSVFSCLHTRGWAFHISSFMTAVCPGSAFYSISVALTESGLAHYQETVKLIFQYIAIITEHGPDETIFNNVKELKELRFHNQPQLDALELTKELCGVMQNEYIPRKWLLNHGVPKRFDAAVITKALACLVPQNCRLTLTTKNAPCTWTAKEKWSRTNYREEKIPEGFLKEITAASASSHLSKTRELHIPPLIRIPRDLKVTRIKVLRPATTPELLCDDIDTRVWYKKDDQFWVPRGSVHVLLRMPDWTLIHVKARLFCNLVLDSLKAELFDCKLVESSYRVVPHEVGLLIEVSGYTSSNNKTLQDLLKMIILRIRNLVVDQKRFEVTKENLIRTYQNMECMQGHHRTIELLRYLTEEKVQTNAEYAAEVENIKREDIQGFFQQHLKGNHIELLAHGNLLRDDVPAMTKMIKETLQSRPLPQSQWHIRRDIILLPGSDYVYEHQSRGSSSMSKYIYYLQIGSRDNNVLRAQLLLLHQIAKEPALTQLYTKDQLGQTVESGVYYSATRMVYYLDIHSAHNPRHVEDRIDLFLKSLEQKLRDMSDEEFASQKNSVINRLVAKPEDLDGETRFLWEYIQSEYIQFQQHKTDATSIGGLTKTDLLQFYRQHINPMSDTRAKLSIHLTAHSKDHRSTEEGVKPVYIRDVNQFKATLQLSSGPGHRIPVQRFIANTAEQTIRSTGIRRIDERVEDIMRLPKRTHCLDAPLDVSFLGRDISRDAKSEIIVVGAGWEFLLYATAFIAAGAKITAYDKSPEKLGSGQIGRTMKDDILNFTGCALAHLMPDFTSELLKRLPSEVQGIMDIPSHRELRVKRRSIESKGPQAYENLPDAEKISKREVVQVKRDILEYMKDAGVLEVIHEEVTDAMVASWLETNKPVVLMIGRLVYQEEPGLNHLGSPRFLKEYLPDSEDTEKLIEHLSGLQRAHTAAPSRPPPRVGIVGGGATALTCELDLGTRLRPNLEIIHIAPEKNIRLRHLTPVAQESMRYELRLGYISELVLREDKNVIQSVKLVRYPDCKVEDIHISLLIHTYNEHLPDGKWTTPCRHAMKSITECLDERAPENGLIRDCCIGPKDLWRDITFRIVKPLHLNLEDDDVLSEKIKILMEQDPDQTTIIASGDGPMVSRLIQRAASLGYRGGFIQVILPPQGINVAPLEQKLEREGPFVRHLRQGRLKNAKVDGEKLALEVHDSNGKPLDNVPDVDVLINAGMGTAKKGPLVEGLIGRGYIRAEDTSLYPKHPMLSGFPTIFQQQVPREQTITSADMYWQPADPVQIIRPHGWEAAFNKARQLIGWTMNSEQDPQRI